MIQLRSVLNVADNSGAKKLNVILVHGGSRRRFGHVGDVVTASVEGADPLGQIKDKQVIKAVIVRTRKERGRSDGTYVRFSDNAAVIIESIPTKEPIGTRIFGPVAREVKERGFVKIASLAPEVV